MSTPPYPAGPPTAAGSPPKDVQTAFQLFIATVVLGLIGAVLSFSLLGAVIDAQLARSGVSASQLGPGGAAQVEAAARSGAIVGAVIGLVLLALFVFFVFKMRAGKNWARITLTVLSAISVIFGLIGVGSLGLFLAAGFLGILYVVVLVLQFILTIAAVVFMFRPAANAYFA